MKISKLFLISLCFILISLFCFRFFNFKQTEKNKLVNSFEKANNLSLNTKDKLKETNIKNKSDLLNLTLNDEFSNIKNHAVLDKNKLNIFFENHSPEVKKKYLEVENLKKSIEKTIDKLSNLNIERNKPENINISNYKLDEFKHLQNEINIKHRIYVESNNNLKFLILSEFDSKYN